LIQHKLLSYRFLELSLVYVRLQHELQHELQHYLIRKDRTAHGIIWNYSIWKLTALSGNSTLDRVVLPNQVACTRSSKSAMYDIAHSIIPVKFSVQLSNRSRKNGAYIAYKKEIFCHLIRQDVPN